MSLGTVKIIALNHFKYCGINLCFCLFVCLFFKKAKNCAVEHAKIPYLLRATNAQMDSVVHSRQCSMHLTLEPACSIFHNKAVKNQTAMSSASLLPL